jgi:metal-responsive CopG/Arc/MetJ family transcriptional regulator
MARILISIPDKMLEELNKLSDQETRSRSEMIRELIRFYVDNKHKAQNGY